MVEYVEGIRLPVETCDHCGERWVRWRYVEEALNRVETRPQQASLQFGATNLEEGGWVLIDPTPPPKAQASPPTPPPTSAPAISGPMSREVDLDPEER